MIEILKLSIMGKMREVPRVTLQGPELEWARYAGKLRYEDARKFNRVRPDGTTPNVNDDMLGAVGEFIAAIYLNACWRGPGKFRGSDVEGGFEVRTVGRPGYKLRVNHTDEDNTPVILVTPTDNPLAWLLPGWILARNGKQEMFLDNPANNIPQFYVDQEFLLPMKELIVR